MSSMLQALYDAVYVDRTLFQWIHFTDYGIVRGALSNPDYTKRRV